MLYERRPIDTIDIETRSLRGKPLNHTGGFREISGITAFCSLNDVTFHKSAYLLANYYDLNSMFGQLNKTSLTSETAMIHEEENQLDCETEAID